MNGPRAVLGAAAQVWVGVDIGTQGCRVAVVDETGQVLASGASPIRSAHPSPGRHEQRPEEWKAAVSAACREALSTLPRAMVGAVAVSGTSGTFVFGDEGGHALSSALMYDDDRGVDDHNAIADAWRDCGIRNGYQVQPTWALPKVSWALRNVPGAATGRIYHVADFIGSWLAGMPVPTDMSHALKTGYDLVGRRWPSEAFEAAGLPTSVLPPVVPAGTVVGRVTESAAAACGLLAAGAVIVAGMTDGCAAQIASGALHVGQWNSSLGTTFVLKGVTRGLLRDRSGAVYSHAHPDDGWLPGGASNSGGGVLTRTFWGADLTAMDRAAATYLPTPVVRYPLSTPGERFPFVRMDAEPFVLGTPRNDAEAYAALLQGVAFVERLGLSYMESLGAEVAGPVAFSGGATRSDRWTQLRVDILGRPARLTEHADGAFGMAVLASAAPGSVTAAADRMVRTRKVIGPRPERTQRFLEVYRTMVDELERRSYIDREFATFARAS